MLEDLLALYPRGARRTPTRTQRPYLVLAERQLAKLRETLDQQAGEQLPQLAERLRAARGLGSDRRRRRRRRCIGRLIDLYGDEPWAAAVVDEARAATREH